MCVTVFSLLNWIPVLGDWFGADRELCFRIREVYFQKTVIEFGSIGIFK
jgi:hypothetical protein